MGSSRAALSLGRLLEFALPVESPGEALAAFRALGLRDVAVGDHEAAPRAVVSDGHFSIGLHDASFDGPAPIFVRPALRAQLPALAGAGIELERVELADDRFHRLSFRDPNGLEITLLEARTFAPVLPDPATVFACGRLEELSVATDSLENSISFWRALGFSIVDEALSPYPRCRLIGFGLSLGLHEATGFRVAFTFRAAQLDARIEYLRAKGFALRRSSLIGAGAKSATWIAPGDVPFFLIEAEGDHHADV